MATIGVKHPVYAPIATIPDESTPTYGAGIILGKMTKVDINFNYAEGSLYADDALAEYDAKLQGGTITIGVDELPITKRTMLFHHLTSTSGGKTTLYACADDTIPHGGFGYYKTLMVDSVRKYKARWYYNVTFHEGNEGAETANDGINFKDTEIIGTFIPVYDADIGDAIYEEQEFTSESDAKTWLDTHAGITNESTLRSVRPVSNEGDGEGEPEPSNGDSGNNGSNTRSAGTESGTNTSSGTNSTPASTSGTKTVSESASGTKTVSETATGTKSGSDSASGTSSTTK